MTEHVPEENKRGLRLKKTVDSDETIVEKRVRPFRSDEEVTIGD